MYTRGPDTGRGRVLTRRHGNGMQDQDQLQDVVAVGDQWLAGLGPGSMDAPLDAPPQVVHVKWGSTIRSNHWIYFDLHLGQRINGMTNRGHHRGTPHTPIPSLRYGG